MEAIDDNDIEELKNIKKYRNEIANEFVDFLSTMPKTNPAPLFQR